MISTTHTSDDSQKIRKRVGDYILNDLICHCCDGGFYQAVNIKFPDQLFAIRMILRKTTASSSYEDLQREIETIQYVNHTNVIALKDLILSANNYYLIFPYCSGGDLADFVKNAGGRLPELRARDFMRQILAGLDAIHAQKIVHGGMKLSNILIDEPKGKAAVLKIADFRKVIKVGESKPDEDGFHRDMVMVGEMLYEMLMGIPPPAAEKYVINNPGQFSAECLDFLNKCLQDAKQNGFHSAAEAKQHPFIVTESFTLIKPCENGAEKKYVFSRKEKFKELLGEKHEEKAHEIEGLGYRLENDDPEENEYEKIDPDAEEEDRNENEYTAITNEAPKIDERYF